MFESDLTVCFGMALLHQRLGHVGLRLLGGVGDPLHVNIIVELV